MDVKEKQRLRQLEVVVFGCHERAHQQLATFLEPLHVRTFSFIEYFCVGPICVENSLAEFKKGKLFFPFIRRLVEQNQFLWWEVKDPSGKFALVPKTRELEAELSDPATFISRGEEIKIGKDVVDWWAKGGRWKNKRPKPSEFVIEYGKKQWGEYLSFILGQPAGEGKQTLIKDYCLAGRPWVESGEDTKIVVLPVATDCIAYGYLMLFVPAQAKVESPRVWEKLGELADNIYLPVLTLFWESMFEQDLKNEWDGATTYKTKAKKSLQFIAKRVPFSRDAPKRAGVPQHFDSEMELPLHNLWKRRVAMLETVLSRKKKEKGKGTEIEELWWRFDNSLVFAEKFWASPGMVKELAKTMGTNLTMKTEREGLRSALIYGGPGSGKDALARMVSLFSSDYFFGEVYTLNMAAIRPSAVTGPLLQGLRLEGLGGGQKNTVYQLEGLLWQGKNLSQSKPSGMKPEKGPGATFILDELNSLDIDLQGILLRILEQGEIVRLFDLEKKYVQHLIVGVVNEDPGQISKESELRTMLSESGRLGTLISGLLYEVLRRTRRLREDLYHRLKRNLYVRLPEIRDRPEDIPIFFYKFVTDEEKDLRVDLDAYRLLMDRRLTWPGNIRQIQTVAKLCVDQFRKAPGVAENRISRDHVLRALKAEFSEVRFDSADREEQASA